LNNQAASDVPDTVAAVLVAGGSGARFGHVTPKQFLTLKAYEIYIWPLSILYKNSRIRDIVVTMPADFVVAGRKRVALMFPGNRIDVVTGGATRQNSVFLALDHLKAKGIYKYVLVHDAVRPFLTAKIVDDTIDTVTTKGACTVGTPVSDTLKKVEDGLIIETVERANLYAVQTPQAAPFETLLTCHEQAHKLGVSVTDDAAILEHFGHKVLILPGQNNNIKITVAEDLRAGELLAQLFLPPTPL
jgi:2-C-methyl-D-erythritol 4-phosphate cytidylyltransferase